VVRCEVDACGSGLEPVVGCCDHGNEPSGSIKKGGKKILA
jgi:hypothetical protein